MVHNETLFCSPRSSDRKHMNRLFSKFQLFACCFQNFCLYAQCLIMVLLIHMAYERWIHGFIYFRPTVSRNTHKGTSYYYIDFFLTSITCGYCSFIAFNLWTVSNHHLWVFREQTLSQKHLFATTKTMRIERQFNIYSVFNSIL